MEKRRFPRYQLAIPLTGLVEQEGERYAGNILNISSGGFLLHLASTLPDRLVLHGPSDVGEIHHAGRNANGFGSLIRVERFVRGGIGVGFAWDKDGMDSDSRKLIDELIAAQEALRAQGTVSISAERVILGGLVSSALANDVLLRLREIGESRARISLNGCTSIDSSGIELLMTLRDRGIPIVDVATEIEGIIRRFQLSATHVDNNKDQTK